VLRLVECFTQSDRSANDEAHLPVVPAMVTTDLLSF
jgi:hypothetical protein